MKAKRMLILLFLYALLIVTGLAGFKVAAGTMYKYKPVIDGALCLILLYLAYEKVLSEKNDKRSYNDILLTFPDNVKTIVFSFFWMLMLYWAVEEIINMFKFLINIR